MSGWGCAGAEAQEPGNRDLCQLLQAAEGRAGEPVFDRLLTIQAALLSGRWASWLRGSKASPQAAGHQHPFT